MNPLASAIQVRYPKMAEYLATPSLAPGMRYLVCVALDLDPYAPHEDSEILKAYRDARDDQHVTLMQIEVDL